MKILLIGSGGREHALAWKLAQSPLLTRLYCAPGNPGTATLGENVDIAASDLERLQEFAVGQSISLTIVGPEQPLVDGIVDRFRAAGLRIAGPDARAAALEGSKVFAKQFLQSRGIPTAEFSVFDTHAEAVRCLARGEYGYPVVIKADGLAAGKGVFVCGDEAEALTAVDAVMKERRFGAAGDQVIVEECLRGVEASFMVFTDGRNILPMVASQDHKAVHEGDSGPNTGGMGAYSVDSILSPSLQGTILSDVIEPTVEGMRESGIPYTGVLYAGLMLTDDGPKVLEFNARFGDPETQVVLPRLNSDLLEIHLALADGDLGQMQPEWSDRAVVCVVLASEGYPGSYESGQEISGLELACEAPDTAVFHAGTAIREGRLVASGGRVLGVTASAPDLAGAIIRAYEGVNKIRFQGMYYRRDIAAKGLG